MPSKLPKRVKVDFLPNRGQFTLQATYSPDTNELFRSHSFRFDRGLKKHVGPVCAESVVFIQSLPERIISVSAKEKFKEYQSVIEALSCHRDIVGEGVEVPELMVELHGIQKVMLKFIRANKGKCILGSEWGSGKTFPALTYVYENRIPTVFACLPDLVEHFKQEIKRLFIDYEDALELIKVISFDAESQLEEASKGVKAIIIDESQRVSDIQSKRFSNVYAIAKKSETVILITGNLISAWPVDFYSQLKLLGVDITKANYIKRFFETSFEDKKPVIGALKKEVLRAFIAPFYIRFTLKDIAPDMEGINSVHTIKFNSIEKKIYDDVVRNRGIILSGSKVIEINKTLSLLKVRYLVKYISNVLANSPDKKLAICSQFSEVFDELKKELPFIQKYPARSQVIFLDTSVNREGHNLSDYDTFIMLDVYANFNSNLQIKRRFLRYGNKSKVFCIYLIAGLLDLVLLKLPAFEDYRDITAFIAKRLDEEQPRNLSA